MPPSTPRVFPGPPAPLTRPDLRGTFGMCATTHWVASATGQAVLERGGNAFDAAVAAAFVLHLVEPHLNGPGGDLNALISLGGAADAGPQVLVGQGPAPAGATIGHFRSEDLDLVPGAGGLAAAVPGAVDAWLLLLRDHGTFGAGGRVVVRPGLRRARLPAGRAGRGHGRLGARAVPAALDHVGGLLAGRRGAAADRHPDDQPRVRGRAPRAPGRGVPRPDPRGPDRGRADRLGDRGRSAGRVHAARAAPPALRRGRPRRRDHARGLRVAPGELGAGDHRGVPGVDGGQERAVGVGPGAAAGAQDPRGLPRRRAGPADRRRRASPRRGAEAGAGRPGRLVRRPRPER